MARSNASKYFPQSTGLLLVFAFLIYGCQTGTTGRDGQVSANSNPEAALSLDDAKSITAEFKDVSYVPVERTITNMKRVLGEVRHLPENCVEIRKERQEDLRIAMGTFLDGYWDILNFSSLYHISASSLGLNRYINTFFEHGRFKDMTKLLDSAILKSQSIDKELGHDPAIVLRASYLMQFARLLAATGERERALKHLDSAELELQKAQKINFPSMQAGVRVYATTKAYLPLISAYKAQLNNDLAGAGKHFQVAYRNRFFLGSDLGPLSFSRMRTEIGQNLLRRGRVAEAEYQVRSAWQEEYSLYEYAPSKDAYFNASLALPTVQLAELYLLQGRLQDARYLAEMAVNMHEVDCSLPNSISLAKARHILAQILAAESDWPAVAALFRAVQNQMAENRADFERLYGGNLEWALALAKTGATDEAIERLENKLTLLLSETNHDKYLAAEVQGILAYARLVPGQTEAALKLFSVATPILLGSNGNQGSGVSSRVQDLRLNLVLEGYRDALLRARFASVVKQFNFDPVSELFKVANVSHLGRVQRALSASAARRSISNPDLADLMRREQDASQRMESTLKVISTLELAPSDQVDSSLVARLRSQFSDLAKARQAIATELSERFPNYANLINPAPATLQETRGALKPDEALVLFHVSKRETLVWAIPKTGPISFSRVPLSRDSLADRVESLRNSLDPEVSTLGEIPNFDITLAHTTYRDLLWPVRAGWQNARKLHVVPHGALGQLPLGLLVTEKFELPRLRDGQPLFSNYRNAPWLISRVAIARYPSVNAFVSLRRSSRAKTKRQALAAFADPYFNKNQLAEAEKHQVVQLAARGQSIQARGEKLHRRSVPNTRELASARLSVLPRLPDTADEARQIARVLKAELSESVFTGIRANEQVVKTTDLSNRQVIVFATHGLVAGDLDGLAQPALALSAPTVANVEGDGLLTMSEILGLKLNADWVVLSACNTGAAEGAGAEAVSGLGRAFFYAGARALLVSNWPVETTSAKALTTSLFAIQVAKKAPTGVEALQQAMKRLIASGRSAETQGQVLFSYAHPLFWAPFTLVGDGGSALSTN